MNKRIEIALVAAGVLLAGTWIFQARTPAGGQQEGEASKHVGLTAAEAQALERRVDGTVRERGVLESAETLEIRSRVTGETTIVSIVPEGTTVKKGDRLVRLDSSQIENEVRVQQITIAKAKAAVSQAERAVEAAQHGAENRTALAEAQLKLAMLDRERQAKQAELEIGQTKREIALSKKRLETLESMQKRLKQAVAVGNAEAAELGRVELEIAEVQAERASAEEQLEFLNKYDRPFRETSLEVAVLSAKSELESIRVATETSLGAAKAELAAKTAELASEESRLEELERRVAACTIQAPRDGLVVYATPEGRRTSTDVIEEGARVREGQPILEMPDMERLQVHVRVHESRIDRVKKGQKVTVHFDALPNRTFRGTVKSVGRTPLPRALLRDAGDYPVIVALDSTDPALKIGLTCLAEIDAKHRKE